MKMFNRIFCLLFVMAPCKLCADFLSGYVVPFPDDSGSSVAHNNVSAQGSMLKPTSFPKTVADLSYEERFYLKNKNYEPYQELKAYNNLVVESEEQFIERQKALAEQENDKTVDNKTYYDIISWDDDNGGFFGKNTGKDVPKVPYSGYTIGGGTVVANNSVRSGACYPASKSKTHPNKILTTGKYEKISPAFEKAMITLFRKEGKCGELPGDECGYTCYGIGENCLGKTLNLDRVALARLTRGEAEDIYYTHFWQKYNIGVLPDVISGDVFLAMMGSGPVTGIRHFRNFLGVNSEPKDKLDENVVNAVANYNGDILQSWLNFYQQILVRSAAEKYDNRVLKGWMNGIALRRENGCHVIPKEPLLR